MFGNVSQERVAPAERIVLDISHRIYDRKKLNLQIIRQRIRGEMVAEKLPEIAGVDVQVQAEGESLDGCWGNHGRWK